MANIQLNHEGVNEAVDQMQQLSRTMLQAVEDLINQLTPLSTSFSGASAQVFQEISRNRQTIYNDLTQNFSAGGSTLSNMHQNLVDGDNRGASILGG